MDRALLSTSSFRAPAEAPPVEWLIANGLVDYTDAVVAMERHADAIADGHGRERIWLVEHPSIYTAASCLTALDLATTPRFPVHRTGRGGQYTYHGPGQRVAYVMLDLKRRKPDVRAFVAALEAWIIATLAELTITGERREDRVGVWVRRPDKAPGWDGTPAEDKIAAIGIRLRRWVSFHGIAINVDPDLSHFSDIVPCGIAASHLRITSLVDLGHPLTMPEFDSILRARFEAIFGPTADAGTQALIGRTASSIVAGPRPPGPEGEIA